MIQRLKNPGTITAAMSSFLQTGGNVLYAPRLVTAAVLAILCFSPVQAQQSNLRQRIGEASSVQNTVVRVSAGRNLGLTSGGAVFRDETVRTGQRSSAKLVFLDSTNLAIGPVSSVVLDRFVFSGTSASRALSVNLARGAFRFTTGVLDKRAYKINTSVATIGVRGTVLDIQARGGRTQVTLVDNGPALVCGRFAKRCVELNQQGQSVEISRTSVRRVRAGARKYSFASVCGSNPGLCSQTRLADASPVVAAPLEAALCGQ